VVPSCLGIPSVDARLSVYLITKESVQAKPDDLTMPLAGEAGGAVDANRQENLFNKGETVSISNVAPLGNATIIVSQ